MTTDDFKALKDILTAERRHHLDHPYEVSLKFWYGNAVIIVGVFTLYFQANFNVKLNAINDDVLKTFACFFFVGYCLATAGIVLHSIRHKELREKIEIALSDLIINFPTTERFVFLKKYTSVDIIECNNSDTLKFNFSLEPSRRKVVLHDLLLLLGILSSAFGTAYFIYQFI